MREREKEREREREREREIWVSRSAKGQKALALERRIDTCLPDRS